MGCLGITFIVCLIGFVIHLVSPSSPPAPAGPHVDDGKTCQVYTSTYKDKACLDYARQVFLDLIDN